jgi:hypothetical protein
MRHRGEGDGSPSFGHGPYRDTRPDEVISGKAGRLSIVGRVSVFQLTPQRYPEGFLAGTPAGRVEKNSNEINGRGDRI